MFVILHTLVKLVPPSVSTCMKNDNFSYH